MANSKRLVIFDLDGVLINSRDMHYKTLNMALEEYGYVPIPYDLHLAEYDGLPTRVKLEKLGVLEEHKNLIWEAKQKYTIENSHFYPDKGLHELFRSLCAQGIGIAVASNAIKQTIYTVLESMNLLVFVAYVASAEDHDPKPSPEMYWRCMKFWGVSAQNTVIVEDSHIGREAAIASGAKLLPAEGPQDLNLKSILDLFDGKTQRIPWRQKNLNVLIPMAGEGSRFAAAGYTFPKPLIDIGGKPMIQLVVENLNIEANYIFLVQKEHYQKYQLKYLLNLIAPDCNIIQVDGKTEGAACTALLARKYIDNRNPPLIANSDQLVEWNSNEVMYAFNNDGIDGGLVTFNSTHPKWSYVQLGETGLVERVEEKKVISDIATTGIYFWKHGDTFVASAEQDMSYDHRVNGEFYIAPTFNQMICYGAKIKIKPIKKMWGLGTPEDLQEYLRCHQTT